MLTAALLAAPVLAAAAPPAPPPGAPDQPLPPLDPRIDPARITETTPPPLPETVILPLPATHRVATAAAEVPIDAAHWQRAGAAIERGLAFLLAAQSDRGAWGAGLGAKPTGDPGEGPPSPVSVAVTAMAIKALAQAGPPEPGAESMRRGLRFIAAAGAEDGSYGGDGLANYVTATVVSALATADEFAHHDRIQLGVAWLEAHQWDRGEGLGPRTDWFGGAGYGTHGRPDLSNTQMMLEALYDAGLSPDEPPFQRALAFVSRTQNLRQTNAAAWAGDDGGFVYTPANGGESMASEAAGEGRRGEKLPVGAPRSLRSYGSMTYAGFKSMLYAGLSPDDVRVRAAFEWIRRHWTFEENPGLGQQGLYYYYQAMARALRVAQQHRITDRQGRKHNWREEIIDAIAARQGEDGSWTNQADRWLEGDPVMATVYAVLAVEEALKPVSALAPPAPPAPVLP